MRRICLGIIVVLTTVILTAPGSAQNLGAKCRQGDSSSCKVLCNRGYSRACAKELDGGKLMVEFGERSLHELQANGLIRTGMVPIFPKDARCTPIASYFGDRTRYDGSKRAERANFGYHGGIDLSLHIGTPIIAIADGTVINVRVGGLLVGIETIVRHSPQDTGLKEWTFSKYKHFSRMPAVKAGQHVKRGETIGLSGNTGTVGGYYGKNGYPHLHMSTYGNEDGAFSVHQGKVDMKNGRHVDPLAFYFGKTIDSNAIRALPADERKVVIPYMTSDDRIMPESSRTVWPVKCK